MASGCGAGWVCFCSPLPSLNGLCRDPCLGTKVERTYMPCLNMDARSLSNHQHPNASNSHLTTHNSQLTVRHHLSFPLPTVAHTFWAGLWNSVAFPDAFQSGHLTGEAMLAKTTTCPTTQRIELKAGSFGATTNLMVGKVSLVQMILLESPPTVGLSDVSEIFLVRVFAKAIWIKKLEGDTPTKESYAFRVVMEIVCP